MKVCFGQIYIQPGVSFPFSFRFQHYLSHRITASVIPSAQFARKYGEDWNLIFRISAKKGLCGTEIRGPSIFKKDKNVEFTVFLPFDVIQHQGSVAQSAAEFLLEGVCSVLRELDIDVTCIQREQEKLVAEICSDPTMLENGRGESL